MTNAPLPQATDEQIREALAEMAEHPGTKHTLAPAPKRPLGRVARIFHRRGMWSVSAAMLAHDPDETPAQAKASDDSALSQP